MADLGRMTSRSRWARCSPTSTATGCGRLAFPADARMEAEVEGACGAGYRERSPERKGYLSRGLRTRVGEVELVIPKLRQGSYKGR